MYFRFTRCFIISGPCIRVKVVTGYRYYALFLQFRNSVIYFGFNIWPCYER